MTAARCCTYRGDDRICGQPATHVDPQRGGMVCSQHMPLVSLGQGDYRRDVYPEDIGMTGVRNEPAKINLRCLIRESADVYHARSKDFLTAHQLNEFRRCPLLYHKKEQGLVPEQDTTAYLIGRAAHVLILEGRARYEHEFAVGGPINPRTGQPYGSQTKAFAEWAAQQSRPVLSNTHAALVEQMAAAVKSHAVAAELLAEGIAEGVVRAEYARHPCQARIDWINPRIDAGIVGLKTADELDSFELAMLAFGYIHQLAFYRALLAIAGGTRFDVAFFPGIPGNRFLNVMYPARSGEVHLVTLPLPGVIDMQDPQGASVPGVPNSVAVGDFDGDGRDDLVVTVPAEPNQPGSAVVLLTRFDPNSSLYAPTATAYAVGVEPCAIAVGQFDGQLGLDIAIANAGSNNVMVLTSNDPNAGTFNPVTTQTTFAVGNEPRGLTTADFDRDGRLDLAVANTADNTVEILLGSGRGLFASWGTLNAIGGPIVFSVDPFDPDNDGDDDIVVVNRNGTATIFVNHWQASHVLSFAAPQTLTVGQGPV